MKKRERSQWRWVPGEAIDSGYHLSWDTLSFPLTEFDMDCYIEDIIEARLAQARFVQGCLGKGPLVIYNLEHRIQVSWYDAFSKSPREVVAEFKGNKN